MLGVCAVAGNVPLPLTATNVRKVLELAGRTDVPAFAGADRPLTRPLVTAEYVHGKSGLDGADLPEPTMPLQSHHAVDFIIEAVMSRPPKSVTLCPLAPLTNIALALAKEPRLAERLEGIDSRLILRRGRAADVLDALVDETGASAVWWTRLYDPAGRKRDEAVEQMLDQDISSLVVGELRRVRAELLPRHDRVDRDQGIALGVQARVAVREIEETHLRHRHAPRPVARPRVTEASGPGQFFEVPFW